MRYVQLKRIISSSFASHVLTLLSGTAFSQVFVIFFSPILSRIYSPEEFGVFSLFLSIISIGAVCSSFRYEMAIVLPKRDDIAVNILALCWVLILFVFCLFGVIIFFSNGNLLGFLKLSLLGDWLYLVPFGYVFAGFQNSINYWLTRKQNFKSLSANRVLQSSTTAITQSVTGYCSFEGGLIIGSFLGQAIASLLLFRKCYESLIKFSNRISIKKMLVLLRMHRDLPFYSFPEALLGLFQTSFLPWLFTFLYSSSIAGFFLLANRILMLPLSLFARAFAQVFFQDFSKNTHLGKNMMNRVLKIWCALFIISLPIGLFFYKFGGVAFVAIFGEKWLESGLILEAMAPFFVVSFVFSSTSSMAITLKQQHVSLIFAIFACFFKCFGIYLVKLFEWDFFTFFKLLVYIDIFQIIVFNVLLVKKMRDMKFHG